MHTTVICKIHDSANIQDDYRYYFVKKNCFFQESTAFSEMSIKAPKNTKHERPTLHFTHNMIR